MAGGDQLHNGTVVGKLEGDRTATMAINDLLREDFIPADKSRGIYFDQAWASMPAVFPVASGGIHVGHMPDLVDNLRRDRALPNSSAPAEPRDIRRATGRAPRRSGSPWKRWSGARGEGRDLAAEGPQILGAAARQSPELRDALALWKGTKFEFDEVDRLDLAGAWVLTGTEDIQLSSSSRPAGRTPAGQADPEPAG